ncbi:MAG TPA: hypothetical protein VFB32_00105 [Rudaea sp.]|nr:hypothetical protein [Rudaea sp.]
MLPIAMELRELSTRFRDAVQIAADTQTKQRLAAHALALAQVAEQIERDGSLGAFVHGANIERFERLLRDALDENVRATVEALLAQEKHAISERRRDITRWRERAGELRATADEFGIPSVQASLREGATGFDQIANYVEALLAGTLLA